jgi:hypothetical protein
MREHVSAILPAAMVPSRFVRLDELPLTVNGKVDWSALPDPAPERVATGVPVTIIDDRLERSVVAVWERLLGHRDFGTGDRFFDVGGTSMLAVLLYTQLEDLLDAELPDPVMDRGWTISEQAELLRRHGYREPSSD